MNIMRLISDAAVPIIITAVAAHGLLTRSEPYEAFVEGAKDGLETVFNILPTLIGLMTAVGVLSGSGALTAATKLISPIAGVFNIPNEALPLILTRLVSASASTGLLLDIFNASGPDSFTGRYVSILFFSTETVFYTMAVYFMSVKITKTRHALPCALAANLAGAVISLYAARYAFGF